MWNPLESKPDFVECGATLNVEFPQIPHLTCVRVWVIRF